MAPVSRRTVLAALAAVPALAAVGCGGGGAPPASGGGRTPVRFAMDWTPNTNHTGLYAAQQQGWFTDAGLDVQILPYNSTSPDTLVLTQSDMLPSSLSIFSQGSLQLGSPVLLGDGLRCVGGALKRLYAKSAVAGTASAPQPGDSSISARSAELGDPILQPGPEDGGQPDDRVAALTAFEDLVAGRANLVDAAVAVLDPGVGTEPGNLPGGPLTGMVPGRLDVDPDELVEKVGRTTGHTRGRITAVEVDGLLVQYDAGEFRFDDQIEITGTDGSFSVGGDSGSVIWRSRDRAPLGLLYAGSDTGGDGGAGLTFANPLATVLAVFHADWVVR